ncbi:hypothetical protein [Actinoplanes sp. NPDC026619]|uniref:hypothetical protein n=1 Tax=Actinoplanes sp. NPDC026619 TaxID=3155798 RepID=UPI0033EED722
MDISGRIRLLIVQDDPAEELLIRDEFGVNKIYNTSTAAIDRAVMPTNARLAAISALTVCCGSSWIACM